MVSHTHCFLRRFCRMVLTERLVDVQCSGSSTKNCAIKLGNVYCDGHAEHKSIGVFSHFHEDHIGAISECIGTYDVLLAHPLTFEGIEAVKPGMRYREQWVTHDYDSAYRFTDGSIRLLKANHIPGSSQIYVESGSTTMLYSGDFNYPDLQTRHAEYLVLDSTHGDPWVDGKTDRKSVKNRMFEYVENALTSNRQVVIQAPSGTLQEILRHFEIGYGRRLDDSVSFIMDKKQDRVLRQVYRAESKEFRHVIEYNTPESGALISRGEPCVVFVTGLVIDSSLIHMRKIMVDRFRFDKNEPAIIEIPGGCRFNLASHASINGIYSYIKDVDPKYVITDNSRSGYAVQLAKMIEQNFPNIRSEFRPYKPHKKSCTITQL